MCLIFVRFHPAASWKRMKKFNMKQIFTLHVYFLRLILYKIRRLLIYRTFSAYIEQTFHVHIHNSAEIIQFLYGWLFTCAFIFTWMCTCIGVLLISSEHPFRPVDVVFDYNIIIHSFNCSLFSLVSMYFIQFCYNWIMRLTSLLSHTQFKTRLLGFSMALGCSIIWCSIYSTHSIRIRRFLI